MRGSSTAWVVAWVVALASLLLIGGLVMGIAMADHMGGGMMWGRSSNARQTAVVASAGEVTVDIRDFDYTPRDLTIDDGTTVTWTNYDSAPHTATDKDDSWDTGRLDKNESASVTFDQPGQYDYYCTYHPYMEATLTVQ